MSKNYFFVLIFWLACLAFPNKSLSQLNCSSCSGSGNASYWCVNTAQQLYYALYGTPPLYNDVIQSGGTVDICGTINLGEIDPSLFPFLIPDYVTLRGNYNLIDVTVIKFPYLYKKSYQCGMQNHPIAPPDDDEDFGGSGNSTNTSTGDLQAFAFKMGNGCVIDHIRLEGPKTDTKEEYPLFKSFGLYS